MNRNSRKYNSIWASLLAPLLALGPVNTHSAPGTLANSPLFTTTAAEPNIFFMMDDSNSMNTEMMTPEYVYSWGGIMEICFRAANCSGATNSYRFVYGEGTNRSTSSLLNSGNDQYVIPTQAALDAEVASANIDNTTSVQGVWRARNFDYNKQYYDPTKTYTAWATYSEITDETAAPIEPTSGTTFNLTTNKTVESQVENNSGADYDLTFTYYPATYWVWVDDNSDGIVDATETKKKIEIKASTAVCADGLSATKADQASGAGCMLRSYADEIDNFANWFTYHRRREFTAKYAVSHVISPANGVRMGIATIHDDNTNEEKAMASMVSDISDADKVAILTALFNMDTTSSTPLFSALEKSGNYYECSGSTPFGVGACAIQKTVVAPATEAAGVCQQNFTLLVTDGDYTDSDTTPGDADGDGTSWTSGSTTYQFDGNPYADTNNSNSLADMAMHFYERDLDGTLANNVPTQCGVDENPGQHMVTYTVGFGVEGNIDTTTIPAHPKLGFASNCTAETGSAFAWTDAGDTTINTFGEVIDDVVHAAYNGRGGYYSASNPDDLVTAINNSMTSISDRKGSAASVSFNSSVLNSTSVLFLGLFNSTNWSGQLLAYSLDATNGDVITPYLWDAGTVLDAYSPSSRKILTMGSTDGVAFQWANLTTAQKNDLKTSTAGATENDANGMARLGFIRGDRGCEQGNSGTCSYTDSVPNTFSSKEFRARASALGDIVHSSTVFVGAPELNWPDVAPFPSTAGNTYSDFKAGSAASRTQVIYTGANDGMLHGFRVSDGQELIAYIPSNLFSTTTAEGLHYLTNPSYSHHYYVDQTPVISDVYIDTTGGGTSAWKTVLVGSERAGGRGLFALDINDPSTFSESGAIPANIVMWEFDSSDDVDLGYTFSKPTIALLENGKWAAIFGNGYNDAAGGDGEAKLFILFLEGGVDGDWTDPGDYIEITTKSGDTTNRNGLSTPTVVDMDSDGRADRVYAGDLNGNMWAFDISGSNTAQWDSAYKQGSTPKPLFTAAANQSITVAPEVITHPSQPSSSSPSNAPNVMVMFGTGQYMATGDNSTSSTQAFYAVWDEGTKELNTTDLVQQTFEAGFSSDVRVPTDTAVDWTSEFGWYINLGDAGNTGERVISSALVRGDLVYFNTLIPSVNPCSLGGSSWFMAVKSENGGRPDSAAFDSDGNGVIDSDDLLDGGSLTNVSAGGTKGDATFGGPQTLADYRYDTSPDSEVPTKGNVEQLDSSGVGRLSWEELPQ